MTLPALLVAMVVATCVGDEIQRTHLIGRVDSDPDQFITRQIVFASWLDESTVIHVSRSGKLVCYDLETRSEKWSHPNIGPLRSLSVSPATNRVAVLLDNSQLTRHDTVVRVMAGDTGEALFATSSQDLAEMFDKPFVVLSKIALSPANGQLMLVHYSSTYGDNAFLLNSDYDRLLYRVSIDASVQTVAITDDGTRLTTFAANDVVCVNSLSMNEELFQAGKRIHEESDVKPVSSDVPTMSGAIFDGQNTIVYAIDNAFASGHLIVEDIDSGETHKILTNNGHIVMDLDVKNRRVAIAGSSSDLEITSLDGEPIGVFESASTQRINCVKFSPSGSQVLVGGADGTVSIFRIAP